MSNLSVHHHNGCILFLNADIDNRAEAGKITRCSNKFVSSFGMKSKAEAIGQNMKVFLPASIQKVHDRYIDIFIRNKRRFNNYLPLAYGRSVDKFVVPCNIIVKLSTQCFDSLSIAGFIRFESE